MSGTATVNPGFGDGPDSADDKPKDEQKPKGEEEESLVTKLTSWMESPTAITIIACVTIVMSIISISTAASAYGTLNSRASDFRGLVDSWIRPPITSLSLPSSSTGSCSGSDTVLFEPSRLAWPGAAAGYCACPRSAVARDIISTTDSCNSNQTTAGCVTDPAIESITMLWKGAATVCAGRDATPRLYQENGAGPRKERPAPTAAGTCPTGWKACGPGLYNNDGSICVRTSESCPVTRVDRLTAAEWASRSSEYDGSVQLGGGSFGDSYYLAWASASAGASADDLYLPYMPFSESQPSLYEELCVGEGRHWYSQASRSTNGNGPTRDSRSCPDAGTDSRWFVVDSTDDTGTEGFLRENFDLNARCTGSNSGNSEVGNIDCSPGDTICTDVRDTGRCQKLRNFATGQSVSVGFMARKEVFWANGCEVDPVFLADRVAPTDDAVGSLLIVLVVNIICNVITMGFCIYVISMVCCCTEDEDGDGNIDNEVKAKYKKIKWGKTVVLGLMGLGKIIPMAVVLGGINSLRTDFDKAKEADCGDAEANETITFLETTLDDAYTNAIISFVSDGFSLAYALYLLVAMLLGWGEEEPSKEEEGKGDDAAAEES